MTIKVTPDMQTLVESELRRGTSKSRIASLLELTYEEASEVIDQVNEAIRPDIGDVIRFSFRECSMAGRIEKLLTNSAVVVISWDYSDRTMYDTCEDRTIVNFKDIEEFVNVEAG